MKVGEQSKLRNPDFFIKDCFGRELLGDVNILDATNISICLWVEELREWLKQNYAGYDVYIHCLGDPNESGHTSQSRHYKKNGGDAVDFHLGKEGTDTNSYQSFLEEIDMMNRFLSEKGYENNGFGIYPQWSRLGSHFDLRGSRARWSYVDEDYRSYETGIKYTKRQIRK